MNYKDINDNELVLLAKEKNEDAINILYEKYKPLINKKCSNYFKYIKDKSSSSPLITNIPSLWAKGA